MNKLLLVSKLAFPDNQDMPSQLAERPLALPVTADVGRKLADPEFRSCLRHIRVSASRVPVPETAVNKDYCPKPGKYDVRFAGKVVPVQPEPITQSVK
jgi:hypothetical protein